MRRSILPALLLASVAAAQPPAPAGHPDTPTQVPRKGQAPDAGEPPPLPPGAMPGPGGPAGPGGPPPEMPAIADTHYTAAITIADGRYLPGQSVPAAINAGKVGDTFATGVRLSSDKPEYNGLIVRGGTSAVTLSDATITLSGLGKSDFLGIGAGVMAVGSVLVVRGAHITTSGAVRTAAVAADGAILKVYDSVLTSHGGPLPAGYVPHIGPGMMEAPAPLGITGTARTSLTMGRSESYFYHSTLIADGWGAFSTDATGGYVYLEANDCTVQVRNSGYGAYADFGAHVVLNRTAMDAATFGGIIAGTGEIRFHNVTGLAGRDAVMIHSVMGDPQEVATLRITGGSFATDGPSLLVKSANADIVLDHAGLKPGNGVLLRTIINEDSHRTRPNGAHVPGTTLALRGGAYAGDVLHEDGERELRLSLAGASLTGAVRNATLSLDGASHWLATGESAVRADATALAAIDAKPGVTVRVSGAGPGGRRRLPGGGELLLVP